MIAVAAAVQSDELHPFMEIEIHGIRIGRLRFQDQSPVSSVFRDLFGKVEKPLSESPVPVSFRYLEFRHQYSV